MIKKTTLLCSVILICIQGLSQLSSPTVNNSDSPAVLEELFEPSISKTEDKTLNFPDRLYDLSIAEKNFFNLIPKKEEPSAKSFAAKAVESDSLALASLYFSTGGNNWTKNDNWLTGPVSSWYGVIMNSQGSVSQLILNGNNLFGSLPEQIGALSELEVLYLDNNQLSGGIPESLENLKSLVILSIINNNLSGSIPSGIGQLNELLSLSLSYNNLSGPIPSAIGTLTKLSDLYLTYNQLSGEIPESIGNMAELRILSLNGNQLSGNLPPQIGNLSKLEFLEVRSNSLSGTIPVEISNLNKLVYLELGFNQFYGEIPGQLGNLSTLVLLELSANDLSGSIPVQLSYLSNLKYLYLDGNELSGSIPAELGNLSQLKSMSLHGNKLSGTIPPQLGNLTNLESLLLSYNQFSGSVPSEIGNLSKLSQFWLQDNQLSSLPDLTGLQGLTELILRNNYFTFSDFQDTGLDFSSIPFATYSPQYDIEINLSVSEENTTLSFISSGTGNTLQWYNDGESIPGKTSNSITMSNAEEGIIYCEIRNPQFPDLVLTTVPYLLNISGSHGITLEEYNALSAFYHSTNGDEWITNSGWLSDASANEWYGISVKNCRVHEISLKENNLTGKLAEGIGAFPKMTYLNLSKNSLSDTIPAEISKLTNLEYLYLYSNQLTGTIPAEIENLKNLVVLYLYDNNLTGTIPAETGNIPGLQYLALSYNELSGAAPLEINNLTNLLRLHINDNLLVDLPVMTSLINLTHLQIENNQFSFYDFQNTGLDLSNIENFYYSPQYEVDEPVQSTSGESIVLHVIEEAEDDEFRWFESENFLTGNTSNELTINAGSSGFYYCEISNPAYPDLTLYTRPAFINIAGSHGIIQEEYDALLALYNSTYGDEWINTNNWLSDLPANFWSGVDTRYGHVVTINLQGNNLSGTLPSEIGSFSCMEYLYLLDNKLTGNIPEELYELTQLKELWLRYNMLSGEISTDISKLSKLEVLQLRHNDFSGTIPEQLGLLTNLKGINLSENAFSGSLPESMNNLENLNYLYLFNMDISALPVLSALSNLSIIQVYGNKLMFEDLSKTGLDFNSLSTVYSPQDSLALKSKMIGIREDKSYTIHFNELTVRELENENNEYQLFKNDNLLRDWSSEMTYLINSFSASDEGEYLFRVRNSYYPELILVSDTFNLYVASGGSAPEDIQLSSNSVDENVPESTIVAQISTVDPDEDDTFIYSLVAGDGMNDADNSAFSIDGENLKTAVLLDYETKYEYKINIQSEDSFGLRYTKSFTIYVNDILEQNISEEEGLQDFLVYPNPTDGNFQVQIREAEDCYLEIIDLQGRLIYSQEVETLNADFNLRLPAGSYLIRLKKANICQTRKLIIE